MDDQFIPSKVVKGPPSLAAKKRIIPKRSEEPKISYNHPAEIVKPDIPADELDNFEDQVTSNAIKEMEQTDSDSVIESFDEDIDEQNEDYEEPKSLIIKIFGSITFYVIILLALLTVLAFKEYHKIKG